MTFRTRPTLARARGLLVIAALLAAGPAGAQFSGQRISNAGATANTATAGSAWTAPQQPFSVVRDGYSCSCVEHYRNGVDVYVRSCDPAALECPDVALLIECREDADAPGCDDYLTSCECDCTALEQTVEFDHGPFDDVLLTGVPDLYQFPYMCGSGSRANAIGCAPIAGAMVFYYWAQQGFGALVDDYRVARSGTELHDWQALARTLRKDYMDGGICVPFGGGQYATPMGAMETALRDYIEDAGYDADVDHYKVCADCNAGAADELTPGAGLALIKRELEAGRPVIMGFNSGRALSRVVSVANDDGLLEDVYTGELSNGTPAFGTIDHYAVITGYRRLDGRDVLTLNLGWDDGVTDVNVQWNPAGKWLHLYTIDIDGSTGDAWCTIDEGVYPTSDGMTVSAFVTSEVEVSHADRAYTSSGQEFEALAGTSCGIAREGEMIRYFDTKHEQELCANPGDLPDLTRAPVRFDTVSNDTRGDGGDLNQDYGPPIADWQQPLP